MYIIWYYCSHSLWSWDL